MTMMAQTVVTCPNCETSFKVDVDATRGTCPSCDISLVFEDIPAAQPPSLEQTPEPRQPEKRVPAAPDEQRQPAGKAIEESVDIQHIEAAVDTIVERSSAGRQPRAADLAAAASVEPKRDYSDVEKKVEDLLSKG